MTGSITPARLLILVWVVPLSCILESWFAGDGGGNFITVNAGVICFIGFISTLTGCGAARLMRATGSYSTVRKRYFITYWLILSLGFIGGILVVYNWSSRGLGLLSGGEKILYKMNVAYSEDKSILGGLSGKLFAMLPVALMLTVYLRRFKVITWNRFCVLASIAVILMVSPRRSMLITACLTGVLMMFQERRLSVLRLLIVGAITFIIVFSFFGVTQFYLGKINSLDLNSIGKSFLLYYNSSIYVMSKLLETNHLSDTWIALNLPARAVNNVFDTKLSVDLSVPFVLTPYRSNTLPAFYYFYRSGGFLGVGIWSFFVGFISTMALKKYKATRSFFYAALSAIMMASIILSVRENFFFSFYCIYWIVICYFVNIGISVRRRVQ